MHPVWISRKLGKNSNGGWGGDSYLSPKPASEKVLAQKILPTITWCCASMSEHISKAVILPFITTQPQILRVIYGSIYWLKLGTFSNMQHMRQRWGKGLNITHRATRSRRASDESVSEGGREGRREPAKESGTRINRLRGRSNCLVDGFLLSAFHR